MSYPRCHGCPIAGACVVESTGHATYCEWARRGGAWLAKVRELSGEPPPPKPTLATRLSTAAGAAGRVVAAVATGEPMLADAAEASRRLAICGACEHYAPPTCRKCGCNIPLKARLATEKGQCPEGKW